MLKNEGYIVTAVSNGLEAIQEYKKGIYQLIIMDVQMPIMNGLDATKKIREIEYPSRIPIMAMTAYAMEGDRERFLASGMDEYIAKPIDRCELFQKIKELLLK
ncbi:response regulator [Natronospora cellulosivora (SeqCode)]